MPTYNQLVVTGCVAATCAVVVLLLARLIGFEDQAVIAAAVSGSLASSLTMMQLRGGSKKQKSHT